MPRTDLPKILRRRLPSGRFQFYANVAGARFSLGTDKSEARRRLAEIVLAAERGAPGSAAEPLTVADAVAAYLEFAERHYQRPDGSLGQEFEAVRNACKPLLDLFRDLPAPAFGPLALDKVRAAMIEAGLSRPYVNAQVHRIRRAFRWCASRELVPASVPHALDTLEPLQRGRTAAHEPEGVRPVELRVVEETAACMPPQTRAMVWIAWWTGCRPGELLAMQPDHVDRSGPTWLYRPPTHKNAWRGKPRTIAIGPNGQTWLAPYLLRAVPGSCVFRPDLAERERSERRRIERRSPLTPSQEARKPRRRRVHPLADRWTVDRFGQAIARGVVAANAQRIRAAVAAALVPLVAPDLRNQVAAAIDRMRARPVHAGASREALVAAYKPAVAAALRRAGRKTRLDGDRLARVGLAAVEAVELIPRWSPGQLRHSAATRLRREVGLEAARVALGHADPSTTLHYAERDEAAAAAIMGRLG